VWAASYAQRGAFVGDGVACGEDDVIAWIADMGWMLGPLLIVGGLKLGATVVMVEGMPTHPTPDQLRQIVGRHGLAIQDIAPTAARA
jgi:acetyl-CoA synthetase